MYSIQWWSASANRQGTHWLSVVSCVLNLQLASQLSSQNTKICIKEQLFPPVGTDYKYITFVIVV